MAIPPAQLARIRRATSEPLFLGDSDGRTYKVKGSTGSWYTIVRSRVGLTCDCPDGQHGKHICKHCCLVAIRTLTPYQQTLFFSSGKLPTAVRTESRNEECCCCYSALAGDRLVCPRCRQGFHLTCIDRWLRRNPTCPCCRGPL